jgi:malonyl-CoA/methylmalonyl-CoA synthetase
VLLDLLDGALADRAEAAALDDLTFRELHQGARRVAERFARLGVRAGDRVVIYTENRLGFVFAYLATLRLAAIAVPANVLYRADDFGHVLQDARPALVVCSDASARFATEAGAGATTNIVDAGEIESWARGLSQPLYESSSPAKPDDVALIVYTSGTTGASKGAMLSHGNLAAIASQLIAAWRWQAQDVLLLTLPLFHVHGLIAGLTASLAAGGRVILRERFDARDVLDRLAVGDVTMFFGVPTMYVRLLEIAGTRKLPSLRLYVSGSAALSAQTHRAFEKRFGAVILERYGASEFGFALGNRYGGPRVPGSVGIPFPGVAVRVVAPGRVDPLPDGEVGELLVSGPNVFCGYWERPDATERAFATDDGSARWYRSGDLACYDRTQDVYRIVGRIKELIITGGFNVYPREIEDAIEAFPGVRACAVVGKPDRVRGEIPVAFVEAEGAAVDADAMLATLRERLASFKIPKEVRFLDPLPRNAMGKLDKPALRTLL